MYKAVKKDTLCSDEKTSEITVADEDLEYEVEVSKHLIHYGIAAVLCKQAKLQQKKNEFGNKGDEDHLGKRVAKVFDVETDDGDNIYRGTVVEVFEVDGKKEYRIKYDDGDVEDVYVETLFGKSCILISIDIFGYTIILYFLSNMHFFVVPPPKTCMRCTQPTETRRIKTEKPKGPRRKVDRPKLTSMACLQ